MVPNFVISGNCSSVQTKSWQICRTGSNNGSFTKEKASGYFFLGTPCSKPADLKQNLRFYCKTCTLQQNLHYEWKTCRFKTKPVVLLQILQYEWKTCWLSETNILYTGHLFLLQLVSIQLCFVSVVNNVSGIYYSLHPGVAALQCRWVGPVYRTSTQLLQLASNQLWFVWSVIQGWCCNLYIYPGGPSLWPVPGSVPVVNTGTMYCAHP